MGKYVWTPRSEWSFNNEYYRNLVLEDGLWIFNNDDCTRNGDAWGNPPMERWAVKANLFTTKGGPIQWIKMSYAGPDCQGASRGETRYWNAAYRRCCEDTDNIPTGANSIPDPSPNPRANGTNLLDVDNNQYSG